MKRIDDVWEGCPEGEILRLVSELRLSYRRLTIAYMLATLALLVLGATLWALTSIWSS